MDLSPFVYKTISSDGSTEILYNSVTQRELPIDSDVQTLREHLFLKDQNVDAIHSRLIKNPEAIGLTFIPTWECNLRCNHCCVLHLLKKKDPQAIDAGKLEIFLHRYFERFSAVKNMSVSFVGGESMLYPDRVMALIDVCQSAKPADAYAHLNTTTNLAYDLNLEHIRVFERLDVVGVSLDGFEADHNKQRFFFKSKEKNPFQKTVHNLKKLIKLGFKEKLFVQAALKDGIVDKEYMLSFSKFLSSLGLELNQTKIGSIFPTKYKPQPQKSWSSFKRNNLFMKSSPCCKYQLMSRFQINPDNSLWDNFYEQDLSYLGTLDHSIDELYDANVKTIFESMPIMRDENCQSCPALGYCWGGCVAGQSNMDVKPSEICSREVLVPHVKSIADRGEMFTYSKKMFTALFPKAFSDEHQ